MAKYSHISHILVSNQRKLATSEGSDGPVRLHGSRNVFSIVSYVNEGCEGMYANIEEFKVLEFFTNTVLCMERNRALSGNQLG